MAVLRGIEARSVVDVRLQVAQSVLGVAVVTLLLVATAALDPAVRCQSGRRNIGVGEERLTCPAA